MTAADLLADAAPRLAAAGVDDPRREALLLLASVTRVSPGRVWLTRDAPLDVAVVPAFTDALSRRLDGAPAPYATRSAAFRHLELYVDEHVLIPRPETEGLVEHVLRHFEQRPTWGTAADVGTGSGCIALSLALEGRFDRIIATDISPEALAVTQRNTSRLPAFPPSRPCALDLRLGDLLAPLAGERLSVLVSNPPYVTASEWSKLDPGVRDHEPRLALVSGDDGMAHTQRLLAGASEVLEPGGLLAIELDCRRAAAAGALAASLGWSTVRIERDLFDRPRYLLATKEPS